MNKRIEEFMWKAKASAKHQQLVDYDFLEKFAELIIRECAMIAIKKQTEDDIDNIVSKNLAKDIAEEFIKHFEIK